MPQRISLSSAAARRTSTSAQPDRGHPVPPQSRACRDLRPGLRTLFERKQRQHAIASELQDLATLGIDRVNNTVEVGVERGEVGLKGGARGQDGRVPHVAVQDHGVDLMAVAALHMPAQDTPPVAAPRYVPRRISAISNVAAALTATANGKTSARRTSSSRSANPSL